MDEGLGALFIVGLVIAAVYYVVVAILSAIGWTFLTFSRLFGSPGIFLVALAAIGALGGLWRFRKLHGAERALSEDDYATIGGFRMTPEQWAGVSLGGLCALLWIFGIIRS